MPTVTVMDELVALHFGDRVTVVSVVGGTEATTFAATVVSHHGNRVEVTLDEPLEVAARPYILVSGEGDLARFVAIEESAGPGRNVPITTLGPWQNAADRRMSSRFPTYRPCELRVGEQATSGHLLDLSMDGVAIEVVAWEGERFVLHVDANERRIEIPCESVGAQQTAGQLMVVRARFDGLTVAEGLAVTELSELVRTDFEAAQARLVSSRRRPTRSLRAS